MNRRNVVRLALAAALFGAAIPGAALAQVSTKWWTPNQQSQRYQDRFQRNLFEGHWVAQDVNADFRGGRSAVMLPNILHIDQERRTVLVADRRHNLVQLIAIDGRPHTMRNGTFRGHAATMLFGEMNGNGKRLVANGRNTRGQLVRQVMMLRDRGNTLVVRTQVERRNGRMVQVERVYQRA